MLIYKNNHIIQHGVFPVNIWLAKRSPELVEWAKFGGPGPKTWNTFIEHVLEWYPKLRQIYGDDEIKINRSD